MFLSDGTVISISLQVELLIIIIIIVIIISHILKILCILFFLSTQVRTHVPCVQVATPLAIVITLQITAG